MPCHLFFYACLFSESACVLSSYKPLFAVWSAFSLPGIPVFGLCVNLDAASLMALIILFYSSYLLLSMFTAVKESVCIVILFLVSLAFSSATRMAVIKASSTDAESLSLMIISSSLCTTTAATRVPSLKPSV